VPLLHPYLLTPCSTVILEKLIGFQLVKKFPVFYGTRRLITAFISTRHLSPSSARAVQSIPPHTTSCISSHLRLGLPSGFFPSGFPTNTLYTPQLSPIRATCPAHLILVELVTPIISVEECRSLISSVCSFLHSSVTFSLLGPNIVLSSLFSNTLSLCSSFKV